jgi:uncharacterized membrane protein
MSALLFVRRALGCLLIVAAPALIVVAFVISKPLLIIAFGPVIWAGFALLTSVSDVAQSLNTTSSGGGFDGGVWGGDGGGSDC